MGVSAKAIESFSEESLFLHIENVNDHGVGVGVMGPNYNCTFNPIEKIVELYDQKVALLERLLESEKEKVEILKGRG